MWRILLPQMKPGITTAVIFVFIPILGEYLTPQLVGGARGVMIGNLIVNFFQGAQYTRGAAAALLIAALIVVLLAVFRALARGRGPVWHVTSRSSRRRGWLTRSALSVWARSRSTCSSSRRSCCSWCSASTRTSYGTFPITGWTTKWYGQVFHDYQIQRRADDDDSDRSRGRRS